MQRHKWAVIGLAAAIGLVGLLGFVSWRINRLAAQAKEVWKATIPIGGGRLGAHPSRTVAVAISSDGHFFLAALEDRDCLELGQASERHPVRKSLRRDAGQIGSRACHARWQHADSTFTDRPGHHAGW